MKKVLLYSGGLDSWLIDKLWKPDAKIYIDIGTSYAKLEIGRLPSDVRVVRDVLHLTRYERDNRVIPLRNLFFVMIACNEFQGEDIEVCLGATNGDMLADKSHRFAYESSELLSFLFSANPSYTDGRTVRVVIPFKHSTKTMLLRQYLENNGSIQEAFDNSFTCYNHLPDGTECWNCLPCSRKYTAFKLNGYRFNDEIDERMKRFITKNIVPKIKGGVYRGAEDAETLMTVE